MNENGHISSPVSIDDVRNVLGDKSTDVGTLCMSDKINPYSLIRPMPVEQPWIGVAQMKEIYLPNHRQEGQWEQKQWGYQVPYVLSPLYIDNIKDVAWYRPDADLEHYKSLDHFDGYLHDATPSFVWAVGDIKQNDEIVVLIDFGARQTDIVSENGIHNNGGVVSILEVFGNQTFYYGVLIKYNGYQHWYYGTSGITAGQSVYGIVNTGLRAQATTRYEITPFITDLPPIPNSWATGAKFYSLKFAPDYESTKIITVPETSVNVTLRVLETDAQGQITAIEVSLHNQYDFYFETSNLYLRMTEQGPANLGYPRTTTVAGLGETLRVAAYSDLNFRWETTIRWSSPQSVSAMIEGYGTLVGERPGYGKQYVTNMLPMERPM